MRRPPKVSRVPKRNEARGDAPAEREQHAIHAWLYGRVPPSARNRGEDECGQNDAGQTGQKHDQVAGTFLDRHHTADLISPALENIRINT